MQVFTVRGWWQWIWNRTQYPAKNLHSYLMWWSSQRYLLLETFFKGFTLIILVLRFENVTFSEQRCFSRVWIQNTLLPDRTILCVTGTFFSSVKSFFGGTVESLASFGCSSATASAWFTVSLRTLDDTTDLVSFSLGCWFWRPEKYTVLDHSPVPSDLRKHVSKNSRSSQNISLHWMLKFQPLNSWDYLGKRCEKFQYIESMAKGGETFSNLY